jgi:glutathione synthase/RimK-type ligase-like ATP-grasp enzyme
VNPSDILENLDMVSNCPVIFQEAIQKDFDLRITVVDDEAYAAKIVLEGCGDSENLDWRNYEGKRLYSAYLLPLEVLNQCVAIVKALGLRFGCVDIGVSKEGDHVFFEVNPQGQWLPSELKLCYDISGSIVEGLTR